MENNYSSRKFEFLNSDITMSNSSVLSTIQFCLSRMAFVIGSGLIGTTIYGTNRYYSIEKELRLHGTYTKKGIFGTMTVTMNDGKTYTWKKH